MSYYTYAIREEIREKINRIISTDDFKWFLGVLLLTFAWMGVAPKFYIAILNGRTGLWLEKVYNLINRNALLNTSVCMSIILFFYCLVKKNVRKFASSPKVYPLFIIAFLFILLYYKSPFEFAQIVWFVDYRIFFSTLLIIDLFFRVFGLYVLYNRKEEQRYVFDNNLYHIHPISNNGFSTDGSSPNSPSGALSDYARSITERLLSTDLEHDSFAVGIVSKWGAGKTTFLKILEGQFGSRVDVVYFNPWMCRTPEQVTNDFFTSLRNQLSLKHRELSEPIKRYAKYLNAVSLRFPGVSFRFTDFITGKSLLERKKELSEMFSGLDNRVVVIIDDLDRLESSEVFEVLRLIRNTADLSNIIYLVAFDKEYVISILAEKNIDDPTSYLEKIFQIEIQLPLVTDKQILNTLFQEIESQGLRLYTDRGLDSDFSEDDKQLILEVITTYRRAQRFARLIALNYGHLIRTSFDRLEWRDLFWLDLLQMNDKKTYDHILCNNPKSILKTDKSEKLWIYDKDATPASKELNNTTKKILLKLFGRTVIESPAEFSICKKEYYQKYFTMQVQFSKENLETLLNTDNDRIDELIKKWGEEQKPIDNFDEIVHEYDKGKIDKDKATKIAVGVFSILYYYSNYRVAYSHFNALDKIKQKGIMTQEELEELLIHFINKRIEKNGDLTKLAFVTKTLCYRTDWKAIKTKSIDIVIDAYFKNHKNYTVLELKKGNTTIKQILDELPYDLADYIVNRLIDGYSHCSTKPTIKQFTTALVEEGCAFSSWKYRDLFQEKLQLIEEKCCSDGQNAIRQEEKSNVPNICKTKKQQMQ